MDDTSFQLLAVLAGIIIYSLLNTLHLRQLDDKIDEIRKKLGIEDE